METLYAEHFLKEAKGLGRKYKRLSDDLRSGIAEIQSGDIGVYLGFGLYKKRLKNSSIPTGKSGGFRLIVYKMTEDSIVLLSIYSKTEIDSLSDEELRERLKSFLDK